MIIAEPSHSQPESSSSTTSSPAARISIRLTRQEETPGRSTTPRRSTRGGRKGPGAEEEDERALGGAKRLLNRFQSRLLAIHGPVLPLPSPADGPNRLAPTRPGRAGRASAGPAAWAEIGVRPFLPPARPPGRRRASGIGRVWAQSRRGPGSPFGPPDAMPTPSNQSWPIVACWPTVSMITVFAEIGS